MTAGQQAFRGRNQQPDHGAQTRTNGCEDEQACRHSSTSVKQNPDVVGH